MNLAKSIVLLALMLCSGVAAAWLTQNTEVWGSDYVLNDVIPTHFGQWVAEPSRLVQVDVTTHTGLEADSRGQRLYDDVLLRTYRRDDGAYIMLAVAYGRRQRQELKIHRPELCYYGQGFDVRHLARRTMSLDTHTQVETQTLLAEKQSRLELVSYWIRIGDQVPRSAWQTRWTIFRDALNGAVPDGALVRVSTLLESEAETHKGIALEREFLSDLYEGLAPEGRSLMTGAKMVQGKS